MKLWQIIDEIYGNYGNRFQVTPRVILTNVSVAQQMAFGKDCRAFERRCKLLETLSKIPSTSSEIDENFYTGSNSSGSIPDAFKIYDIPDLNKILDDFVLSTFGKDDFTGECVRSLDGQLYIAFEFVSIGLEKRSGNRWRKTNTVTGSYCYSFPADCRQIKEVKTNEAVWIDSIKRTIETTATLETEIIYYISPEDLTCANEEQMDLTFHVGTHGEKEALFTKEDEVKVIVPNEWRWQVLVLPAIALCDTANYGDKTPQSVIEQYMSEFWKEMDKRTNDRTAMVSAGAW